MGLFGVLLPWSLRFGTAAYRALVAARRLMDPGERGRCPLPAAKPSVLSGRGLGDRDAGRGGRSRRSLGGYEWGQLGYLTHDLPLRSAAGLVGTLGLTAFLD